MPRERGSVKAVIKNPNFLLYKHGQDYANRPLDALKEYASNSIDNYLQNGLKNIAIRILVDDKNNTIYVQDNGTGMSQERLISLPASFGDSTEKRTSLVPVIGENALGLLAYQGFDPKSCKMAIYSRQLASRNGIYYILYPSGNELLRDKSFSWGDVQENELPPAVKGFENGTIIAIQNIPRPVLNRVFKPEHLQREFSVMYDPLLRHKAVKINVVDISSGASFSVDPIDYRGQKIFEDKAVVEYFDEVDDKRKKGEIEFLVFADKRSSNQRLRVFTKGVRLKNAVTDLKDVEDAVQETWDSGHVFGYVNETICRLNAARADFIPNEQYKRLVSDIQGVQSLISDNVRIYIESKEDKELRIIANDFLESSDTIIRLLAKNYPQLALRVTKPTVDGPAPRPEVVSGRQHVKSNGHGTETDNTRTGPRYHISYKAFDLEPQIKRSRVRDTVVEINTDHPDWKKEVVEGNSKRRSSYIYRQAAEQMASAEVLRRSKINNIPVNDIVDLTNRIADDIYFSKVQEENKEK